MNCVKEKKKSKDGLWFLESGGEGILDKKPDFKKLNKCWRMKLLGIYIIPNSIII